MSYDASFTRGLIRRGEGEEMKMVSFVFLSS